MFMCKCVSVCVFVLLVSESVALQDPDDCCLYRNSCHLAPIECRVFMASLELGLSTQTLQHKRRRVTKRYTGERKLHTLGICCIFISANIATNARRWVRVGQS